MPRTKSLQHYPDRYQEILRECGVEGKRISVPMEDAKQAASLRGHWYAFLGSLKAEVRRSQVPGHIPTEGDTDLQQLSGLAATVMVTIEMSEGKIWVVFQSREHSWQAKVLRGAVVTTSAPAPTTAPTMDATAARLMQLQKAMPEETDPGADPWGSWRPCPLCEIRYPPEELTTHSPCYEQAERDGGT